ncbi:MAG: amidohydrolase family protein [Acidobacteriota bacterium]
MLGITLASGILFATAANAQRPEPPPFYAIRDARVVIGTGEVLERATVLIADGLIEAVGTDLEVPSDAWTLDGKGLTLYPGLIQAMSDLGQAVAEDGPPRGGSASRGQPPPSPRGPEDRPLTTPWKRAADQLIEDDRRIANWREAGFTAALTVPTGGVFPGQSALIHLGESEASQRVLASPVTQSVSLDVRSRTYPSSLMGRIAYAEQVLSDARYATQQHQAYERDPRGWERPTYDRALDPIREAIEGRTPFLMPADREREIDRALTLSERWQIEPILVGGQAAYARAKEIANHDATVMVSLDWPEADNDADPEADTPLPVLYHRRMAPKTPAALAEAGVAMAFTSGELSGPGAFFDRLRVAIDAGLSADDALTALTLGAARMLGVDRRLGSIEVGKIANLMLATAEPWAEDVEIRAVFVDGRKYEERQEDAATDEPPSVDVSGTWALELATPRGNRDITAELEMKPDGKVSGELSSERGTSAVEDGRVSGDRLSFKTRRTAGPRTFEAGYSLNVADDSATGSMKVGSRTMELSGKRTAAASKEDADEEPAVSDAELEQAMARYRGPAQRLGSFAITNARVYTVADATHDRATVVVRDGKIAAVGPNVEVPSDIEVFDAAGDSLIPGIVDAHSHITTDGGVNESSLAVTSMVTIQDVIDPDDIAIYRALAGGVTTINVLHGSANPIGGGNAVLKLRWGSNADCLRFVGAPSGIKFALGENPKRSRSTPRPGVPRRYPATRMGVIDVIRQAFNEARAYQQAIELAQRDPAKPAPRPDRELDRLVEVLTGERLVHAHCYRADEIVQLMQLAEDFGFRVATLQHVLEGYKVADEIAAHGAGASTFSDWWGFKIEAYDAIPHNAALMTERGVLVSINSDSGEEMRHLNQEAAKAMKWGGLDEDAALRLITLNPAIQLGIDDRVGSIEVGKDADLTLYDGHPLSVFSVVKKTFIDGDLYFDLEADRERQAVIDGVKARLQPKEEAAADDTDAPQETEALPTVRDEKPGGGPSPPDEAPPPPTSQQQISSAASEARS